MITSSQQQLPPIMQQGAPFTRNGMPSLNSHHNPLIVANGSPNSSELTGDSLWDSLYNTTIRTLSLDGLELLAKSFDNLDPNHQLYAGIAKRQRKLLEYQSEFRRNLEVFCQRANLNPKMWPSCIRHVKPAPREAGGNTSGLDLLGWSASGKKEPQQDQGTPSQPAQSGETSGLPAPLTPLPQPQLLSPTAGLTSTPSDLSSKAVKPEQEGRAGDSWSPKHQRSEESHEGTSKEKEQDLLSTELASSSINEDNKDSNAASN